MKNLSRFTPILKSFLPYQTFSISIFTYNGEDGEWSEVGPDPEFSSAVNLDKSIPDMALYNLKNTHYDLLVKDDSRIAVLGLLGGAGKGNFDKEWKTVKPKRKNTDANYKQDIF